MPSRRLHWCRPLAERAGEPLVHEAHGEGMKPDREWGEVYTIALALLVALGGVVTWAWLLS